MKDATVIPVAQVVGGPFAVSSEDGQLVYDQVICLLGEGHRVVLSFTGIETLISAFLNAAIGQLYGSVSELEIREKVSVTGLSDYDLDLLKRVVDNAKRYFANPDRFDRSWREDLSAAE